MEVAAKFAAKFPVLFNIIDTAQMFLSESNEIASLYLKEAREHEGNGPGGGHIEKGD